jgi:hypothetical protein
MRVETWADPMRRPGWRGPPRLVCKEDDVNEQKFATYFKKTRVFLKSSLFARILAHSRIRIPVLAKRMIDRFS